jgi:DNA-binding transcriptional LysR family regulator
MIRSTETIQGYAYGAKDIQPSSVSMQELEDLKVTVGWMDDDPIYLRLAGEALEDQTEQIVDRWRNVIIAGIPNPVPSTFRVEPLFEDVFLCVLGRKLKRGKSSVTIKEYLSFRHISVETQPNEQNLIDRSLSETGLQRRVAVHLPYFLAAIRTLEMTELVLTMPARIAEPVIASLDLPRLKAPREIPPIRCSIVWHPRFDSDPLHVWLRETVRQIFHRRPH